MYGEIIQPGHKVSVIADWECGTGQLQCFKGWSDGNDPDLCQRVRKVSPPTIHFRNALASFSDCVGEERGQLVLYCLGYLVILML